ncbi:MAG: DUF4114 domain-containing protein [Candidatus Rokuibacteriota bacterium]
MRHALRTTIAAALASAALCLAGGGEATATTIMPNPGGEPSLATAGGILDSLYGLSNLTRIDDGSDQLWTNIGTIEVTAVAKYSAYSQLFGYLPGESGGTFVPLFSVAPDGLLPGLSGSFTVADSGPIFRWADDPNGAGTAPGLWSSLESGNGDSHLDHMVTFQITGAAGHPGNALGAFVIAFEDFSGGGDRDYNDLVIEARMIAPSLTTAVPAPGSLALLAAALVLGGSSAWWRRRRV